MDKHRILLKQYQTDVIKSFEFCKRMFSEGFETEAQFNTTMNVCNNYLNMCNRLCKKLKPSIPFIQLRKNKIYKEFWNTCNYTINQLNSMIQTTQAEFDKIAEIEELRETMETKALIEYEIAQKIKQLDLDRIDEIKTYNKIGFNINTEDNE